MVQRQVPSIETVQKTVEVPQTQHTDKVADVPVARPRHRVANELGGRNCVTGEMRKNELPSRLDLNSAISDDIDWQCKHYNGRGVRKLHESDTASVEDMEAPVLKMPDSIEAHYQASLKTTGNPNGEPYPAFAGDKSWSEASGEIASEKKFYHNVSSGADFAVQPFSVAEYVEAHTRGHVWTRRSSSDHRNGSGTQTGPP